MIKKIKRRLLSKNNGGFTLVEVIVAAALLGVLLVGIMTFMSPVLSSINSEEKNVRAENIATSVEYYLSRSLRNAAYIAIYTGCDFNSHSSTPIDAVVQEMYNNINGKTGYNLKCISLRWAKENPDDVHDTTKKYYLCNERFETSTGVTLNPDNDGDLDEDYLVFDKEFFRDLFIEVNITRPFELIPQYEADGVTVKTDAYGYVMYETETVDGVEVYKNSDKQRDALKIDVNIYNDQPMGHNDLIYSGTGYTDLLNIQHSNANPSKNLGYKVYPGETQTVNISGVDTEVPTGNFINVGDGKDIYIFYAERTPN